MKQTFYLFLSICIAAMPAFSQAASGTIVGTVTDESGAAIPDVSVTLRNTETGFSRSVSTNSLGQYVAAAIPTGTYSVAAEKTGFGRLLRDGLQLSAADTATVNLALRLGDLKQTVEVTGSAPLLEAQNADVSQLIDNRRIVEMPLNGRTFTALLLLTPGAHVGSSGNLGNGVSYSMRGSANYSVNGANAQDNSYLIDGLVNRNLWLNTLIMVPTIDSIQEFRVMTSNYSAEYGSSAGAVTIVQTKSGTNGLHGTAYEFLRNDKLDANTFFNNRAGVKKQSFRRNEFGATAGGPIRKDRTFFFADYQGIRLAQPLTITQTIPTVAQRNMILTGNFAALGTPIFDPTMMTTVNGVTTRQPFAGGVIPTSRLDPAAVKIASLLPNPTSPAATRNFTYNPTQTFQNNQFDARIDQIFGTSDRFFGKYSFDDSTQTLPGALPAPANAGVPIGPYLSADTSYAATSTPLRSQSLTLDYAKVINATTVNEARGGVVRWVIDISPLGNPFATASAVGIPGVNINNYSGGLPALAITGFQVIGDNTSYPEFSRMTIFQYEDNLSMVRGSHSIKVGGQFLRDRFNGYSAFPTRGSYNFNGQFTRQAGTGTSLTALSDFALGAPSGISRNILASEFGMRMWSLNLYAQDSWRLNNRLTLNYGLRWEINAPPVEVHDHWSNYDFKTNQLALAGKNGYKRALRNLYYHAFAPRAGFAYMLTRDQKTVLRSGFGISYVEPYKGGGQLYKNLPFFFAQTITSDQNGAPPITLSQGIPAPVAPDPTNIAQLSGGNPTAWDFGMVPTKTLQWSIGVQRQVQANLVLDVTYVGTRALNLTSSYNYNQPIPGPGAQNPRRPLYKANPLVGDITYNTGWGSARYHGLQVKLEKRYSAGLTASLAYTWASFLSNAPNVNGGGVAVPQNSQCFNCNWGPVADDIKHVLVVNHAYELPFGPGRKYLSHGLLAYLAGNWDLNGIWSINTGQRFTPVLASGVSNSSGGGPERPNRIRDGNLDSGRTIDHWFDTAAFTIPSQYTFGNAGTGILVGPGLFNVDFGIHRNFPIRENIKLNFRGEMFNALNHANFNTPNASIGNAQAGQISSTGPARVVQLGLKLLF